MKTALLQGLDGRGVATARLADDEFPRVLRWGDRYFVFRGCGPARTTGTYLEEQPGPPPRVLADADVIPFRGQSRWPAESLPT